MLEGNDIIMSQQIMEQQYWFPTQFTIGERDRILSLLRDMGQQMRDWNKVLKISQIAAAQSKHIASSLHGYHTHSLAHGPLGLALMYGELDRLMPDEGWDQVARSYLALLQPEIATEGYHSFGLFTGISGYLLVADRLSRGTLDSELCDHLVTKVISITKQYQILNDHPYPTIYNLASGIVGIGAMLLTLSGAQDDNRVFTKLCSHSQVQPCLSSIAHHLAWLAKRNIQQEVHDFNHWYLLKDLKETQIHWHIRGSAYKGYGMWSGTAGLIALLSLVILNKVDIRDSFVPEAIRDSCKYLQSGIQKNTSEWQWIQNNHRDEYHHTGKCASSAWCHGTSGIARSLWLAGQALQDSALCTRALELIAEICQHFQQDPKAIGPSLCHGLAGVMLTCAHFVNDTRDAALADCVHTMIERLLELSESDRPFRYRAFESEYIRVDSPWLLDGASGVALALMAMVSPQTPDWDRAMLLA